MKVVVHERFSIKQQRVQHDYVLTASERVAQRFYDAVNEATDSIMLAPAAAGHLIPRKFRTGLPHRRRNLKRFPYFIVYSYEWDVLTLLWLVHSRSNPENYFTES